MVKRWCGSSAPAPVARGAELRTGKRRSSGVLARWTLAWAVGASLSPSLALAQQALAAPASEATAAPSPDSTHAPDAAFLALPAYDLERLDPTPVLVGDRVKVRAAGLSDPKVRLALPPGAQPSLDEGWAIAEPAPETPLALVPLKPGRIQVPSLALQNEQGVAVGRTNPFSFDVTSAIASNDPKPEEPAPLRPPVSLSFPWWLVVLGALLAIGLVAALVYGYRQWRRKHRKTVEKPAGPPRPEDEVALEAFAALERENLPFRGQFKKHYFRVSEILKAYLGARYDFDAVESTSREIVLVLEDRTRGAVSIDDGVVDRIEKLFETLDRVKFTDHVPAPDEPPQVLEEARKLVFATRRRPQPAPVVTTGAAKGDGGEAG